MRAHRCLAGLLALAMSVGTGSVSAAEEAVPAFSRNGADTCLNCHNDAKVLSIFRTKHAQPQDPQSPFGHGQLQCEACHGPGGAHTARVKKGESRPPVIRFGSHAATPVDVQNGACLGCHKADMNAGWHGGAHDDNRVACVDCHRSHAEKDPVLVQASQPDVCGTCHQAQRMDHAKAFTHPLRQGQMSCTGCHSPHGTTAEFQLVRQNINETCATCHAEKRGPFLWEHAPVAEDCTLCHASHGSSQPGMLKQRGPLLCQQCHSQAGHPSFVQGSSALPGGAMPSSYLLGGNCLNCHSQIHGSNHPSGAALTR